MNLYLIERIGDIGYDEYDAHIIAAVDPGEARRIASDRPGDEGSALWLDERRSTVKLLGLATARIVDPRILLSFNAG